MATWSAPVRYAEVDGQGVVFNSHYLLYCDEAMAAYSRERGLLDLADRVQLVTSTLTWKSGARWGEQIDVDVSCTRVGRTSFELDFAITADDRPCCEVRTTYVYTDAQWRPVPVPDEARELLLSPHPAAG
jgi:acyl-CoA thioester hydrolase